MSILTIKRSLAVGSAALLAAAGLSFAAAIPASAATHTCNDLAATIVGTNGHDDIEGTRGRDVIVGLAGNDEIDGNGGNDVICGNAGNDEIDGGPGNDWLHGGAGHDELDGDSGADTVYGSSGHDDLDGSRGTRQAGRQQRQRQPRRRPQQRPPVRQGRQRPPRGRNRIATLSGGSGQNDQRSSGTPRTGPRSAGSGSTAGDDD